jgi:chromosome segregation ATPase
MLEYELVDLKKKLQDFDYLHQEHLQKLVQQKEMAKDHQEKLDRLQKRLLDTERAKSELKGENSSLNNMVQNLQTQLKEQGGLSVRLEQGLQTEKDLEKTRTEKTDLKAKIKELNSEIAELKSENAKLESRVKMGESKMTELKDRVKELESNLKGSKQENGDLKKENKVFGIYVGFGLKGTRKSG